MEENTATIQPNPVAVDIQPKADDMAPIAKGDKSLWGIYIFLIVISIVELYSASSREVASAGMGVYGTIVRHAAQLLIGFGIICYLQRTHYRVIYKWIIPFVLGSMALMLITMFFGEEVNGARRGFHIGPISIVPSEFIKLSAAAIVALITSRCQVKGGGVTSNGVYVSAFIIMVFCAMLAPQGLTNTLLLVSISGSMLIVGGAGVKKLMIVLAIYVSCFGLYVGYQLVKSSMNSKPDTEQAASHNASASTDEPTKEEKSRLTTWIERLKSYIGTGKPKYEEKFTSENRQEMLGYMAQAHGGVTGVMPGNSRETSRLPLAFTDYIYSIIVEELGLWGGLFVLVLYLWLLARASAIASRCSRAFPALLVIGMALTVVFQALFHICIVTGVIPVSGQPLPLISKGGCSIVVTSIAFGVMLSVSRFAVRTNAKKKEIRSEIDALPTEIAADNPTQL